MNCRLCSVCVRVHINGFGFHIDNMYNTTEIIGSNTDSRPDEVFSIFSICFGLSS